MTREYAERIRTLTVKQLEALRLLGIRPRARLSKALTNALGSKGLVYQALGRDGIYRWHIPSEVALAYLAYVDSMRNWTDEEYEELENRT